MRSAKLFLTATLFALLPIAAPVHADVGGGGLANPASQLCVDNGGTVEMLSSRSGQAGFCRIDRVLIEEWTLLRQLNGSVQQAVDAFLAHAPYVPSGGRGGANPASVYCAQVGGKPTTLRQADGGEVAMCQFADRSLIEAWTLLRGPADPDYAALAAIVE